MSKENHTDMNGGNAFVLKHRVTGAAFLLFFGALFLPWLLGPPSEASKATKQEHLSQETLRVSPSEVEGELLDESGRDFSDEEDQVYISRITPLDSSADDDLPAIEEKQGNVESSQNKPEQTVVSQSEPSTENAVAPISALDEPDKVETAIKGKDSEKVKGSDKASDLVTKNLSAESKSEGNVDARAEKALQAALAEEPQAKVEIGWAVQVGVFEKDTGAKRVVKDLTQKGFKPSMTVVDTNRGKGTRVWLGPFSQRVEAAKAKAKLTRQTGEAGFIRKYP